MVLLVRNNQHHDDMMPQTVPSAGFTPPCDYSNFAENFDLSLLPPPPSDIKGFAPLPRAYSLFPCSPTGDIDATDFSPNFLITPPSLDDDSRSYLDVFASSPSPFASQSLLSPNPDNKFGGYRQSSEANFYPSSPELSLYTPSPSSAYSQSPRDEYFQDSYVSKAASLSPHRYSPYHRVKEEKFLLSPCAFPPSSPNSCYSNVSSPEAQINSGLHCESDVLDLLEGAVLDKQISDDIRRRIKTEESTVDFGVLGDFQDQPEFKPLVREDLVAEKERGGPKDHQLLRSVLRDTSFQKKFNIRPIDFGFLGAAEIKMEEPDPTAAAAAADTAHSEMMRENIEPVFNLAIEQMRKDVSNTCKALGIAPDPTQWTPANVLSWLEYTSRQFNLSEPIPDQWDMSGAALASLTEEDFTRRSPQGGMILHAQLEIWKAAYSEEEGMPWMLETTSSNASSGDVSDDDDEEASSSQADPSRPTTSRSGGAHIHLWQFLKELLASPQTYGSCIRWLDRAKGIFKIEDSVKVARLWGKRKNRPAMNYDKLSRSIRQYYKKGIMKKTERSQRLVYQFCHPYNL